MHRPRGYTRLTILVVTSDLILISALHATPFLQDQLLDQRRCTAGDRSEPLDSDEMWTKRGPSPHRSGGQRRSLRGPPASPSYERAWHEDGTAGEDDLAQATAPRHVVGEARSRLLPAWWESAHGRPAVGRWGLCSPSCPATRSHTALAPIRVPAQALFGRF